MKRALRVLISLLLNLILVTRTFISYQVSRIMGKEKRNVYNAKETHDLILHRYNPRYPLNLQCFGAIDSGVYPVFENEFKVNVGGKNGSANEFKIIADIETFSVSIDSNIEEWTPMDTEGWIRRLMTGKGFTITLSGKRNIGDPGNDYVDSLKFLTGQDTETQMQWVMPSGTTVTFNCIINQTTAGGDSTAVDALDFEAMSNGKPTVTPKAPVSP